MFDYLNAKGEGLNWLNNKPFSNEYYENTKKWANLPIYQNTSELKKFVDAMKKKETQLIVVQAGTGTGKTALIPKVVLKSEMEERSFNSSWKIAMTIPKTNPTKQHGEFAASTLDTKVGKEVGYVYRESDSIAYDRIKGRLTYLTDGYLLALSQSDPNFTEYSVIIIDEAHERSKNIDFLIYKLKKALRIRQGDLKVIIVSATIKPSIFIDYFCGSQNSFSSTTVTFTAGTSKPIKDIFLQPHQANLTHALNLALKNDLTEGMSAVVFVSTGPETEKGCKEITKLCQEGKIDKDCKMLKCFSLYGKLSLDDQEKAKESIEPPFRKVVFSTNIAESSVTIKNLKVVIDTGLQFDILWNPLISANEMGQSLATKAQIQQRRGRVGRTSPGTVYYLYTKENLSKRPEMPSPNVHKENITEDVLKLLKNTKLISICLKEFENFLTPPKKSQIISALHNLYLWGLIDFKKENTQKNKNNDKEKNLLLKYDSGFDENNYLDNQNEFMVKEGTITQLGNIVLKFSEILKTSLHNILILVAGFVLFDKNDLSDVILLFSILEMTSAISDPVTAFFNVHPKNLKAIDFKTNILNRTKFNTSKEHSSLVNLFKYLKNTLRLSNFHPFINMTLIETIHNHFASTQDMLINQNFIKNDKLKLMKDELIQNNILSVLDKKSKSIDKIDICIFYARYIYLSFPQHSQTHFQCTTKNTLYPMIGKNKIMREKIENSICIFESANVKIALNNSNNTNTKKKVPSADIKLITLYPNHMIIS